MHSLSGTNVMIVEDDYLLASELADHFNAAEATVIGPFASVAAASWHIKRTDLAVLDVSLKGHKVYPLADLMLRAAIPFVFYSAQDDSLIPPRFSHISRLLKPQKSEKMVEKIGRTLHQYKITAIIPHLRLSALLILESAPAADRLVEATLKLALRESNALDEIPPLEIWLPEMMNQALRDHGQDLLN